MTADQQDSSILKFRLIFTHWHSKNTFTLGFSLVAVWDTIVIFYRIGKRDTLFQEKNDLYYLWMTKTNPGKTLTFRLKRALWPFLMNLVQQLWSYNLKKGSAIWLDFFKIYLSFLCCKKTAVPNFSVSFIILVLPQTLRTAW